jgi:hypothetical protein
MKTKLPWIWSDYLLLAAGLSAAVAMEATGYPGGALLVAFGPVTWARWARRQKMARS